MDGTKIMKTFNGLEIYDEAAREQATGVTTTGDGAAYVASVKTIDALVTGVTFVMTPHVTSTTTAPTLDVNGLGAKNIRMRLSSSPVTTIALPSEDFIRSDKPIRLIYDGSYWIIEDMVYPNANGLYGAVPVSSGGTGGKTVAEARKNLGLGETDGALPIANGGTGATNASEALNKLGITWGTSTAPTSGAPGSIYIQIN